MLKIKNADGEELMRINDDGSEEFKNAKFEEQYKEAGKKVNEKDGEK